MVGKGVRACYTTLRKHKTMSLVLSVHDSCLGHLDKVCSINLLVPWTKHKSNKRERVNLGMAAFKLSRKYVETTAGHGLHRALLITSDFPVSKPAFLSLDSSRRQNLESFLETRPESPRIPLLRSLPSACCQFHHKHGPASAISGSVSGSEGSAKRSSFVDQGWVFSRRTQSNRWGARLPPFDMKKTPTRHKSQLLKIFGHICSRPRDSVKRGKAGNGKAASSGILLYFLLRHIVNGVKWKTRDGVGFCSTASRQVSWERTFEQTDHLHHKYPSHGLGGPRSSSSCLVWQDRFESSLDRLYFVWRDAGKSYVSAYVEWGFLRVPSSGLERWLRC